MCVSQGSVQTVLKHISVSQHSNQTVFRLVFITNFHVGNFSHVFVRKCVGEICLYLIDVFRAISSYIFISKVHSGQILVMSSQGCIRALSSGAFISELCLE